MPFDDDDYFEKPKSNGLKNVSSQKSMFDGKPKQSNEEFLEKVKNAQSKTSLEEKNASKFAVNFYKMILSKETGSSEIQNTIENDLLKSMISYAKDLNDEDKVTGSEMLLAISLNGVKFLRNRVSSLEKEIAILKAEIKEMKKSNS